MFSSNGYLDEMSRHFVEILSLLFTILFKNKAYFFFLGGGGGEEWVGETRELSTHTFNFECVASLVILSRSSGGSRGGLLASPPLVFKISYENEIIWSQ